MTIDEVFSKINQHMIEGLMFHSQLSDFFCFLGLKGYSAFHIHQFFEESDSYKKINQYYLKHYGKLIRELDFNNPKVIPDNWYNYTRNDVDKATKRAGVETGFEKWINWESSTLRLYEQMYTELINLGEIAAAVLVQGFIADVDEELATAKQKYIELKVIDFDLVEITSEQEEEYDRYKRD